MRNILNAMLLMAFLMIAHKAAADVLAMRHLNGAIVLTDRRGDCPATYAVAVVTSEPDKRAEGCWGISGELVWVFMPMRMPMSFHRDDFDLLK